MEPRRLYRARLSYEERQREAGFGGTSRWWRLESPSRSGVLRSRWHRWRTQGSGRAPDLLQQREADPLISMIPWGLPIVVGDSGPVHVPVVIPRPCVMSKVQRWQRNTPGPA